MKKTTKLKRKRKGIDLIDRKLLDLLNQRLRIAMKIGRIKKEMGEGIYDPRREKEVLERLRTINRGPLRKKDLEKVFRTIMSVCRKSENRIRPKR
jgi:chorismate mutase/prephenate dehydratase